MCVSLPSKVKPVTLCIYHRLVVCVVNLRLRLLKVREHQNILINVTFIGGERALNSAITIFSVNISFKSHMLRCFVDSLTRVVSLISQGGTIAILLVALHAHSHTSPLHS